MIEEQLSKYPTKYSVAEGLGTIVRPREVIYAILVALFAWLLERGGLFSRFERRFIVHPWISLIPGWESSSMDALKGVY